LDSESKQIRRLSGLLNPVQPDYPIHYCLQTGLLIFLSIMRRIARHKARFNIPVPRAEEGVGYPIETAAELTGIRPELIRYYCERRLISPVAEREPGNFIFDAPGLCAMRRITILRREHGLDFAAARIIVDLLQQVDDLRRKPEA
jgi:hypothetical protein